MRTLLLFLAICACSGIPSVAQEQRPAGGAPSGKGDPVPVGPKNGVYEKYSPPESGFSVGMPGKPFVEEVEVETDVGNVMNHIYSVEVSGVAYAVNYAEFPAPVSDPEVIKGMLDNGRDRAVVSLHGKLKSEEAITLNGYTGREWLVSTPEGELVRARAYWVRERLYQAITLISPVPNPEIFKSREAEVKKFLDSFTLLGDAVK